MGIRGRVPQEVSYFLRILRQTLTEVLNRGGSVDGGFQIFRTDGHLQMKSTLEWQDQPRLTPMLN